MKYAWAVVGFVLMASVLIDDLRTLGQLRAEVARLREVIAGPLANSPDLALFSNSPDLALFSNSPDLALFSTSRMRSTASSAPLYGSATTLSPLAQPVAPEDTQSRSFWTRECSRVASVGRTLLSDCGQQRAPDVVAP